MKLLILGGTVFLGRHLVEAALSAGHEVTLFNRGQHHPELFPQVEKLRGDRDGNLDALAGRRWDAVVDTCGFVPRVVQASAELLASSVDHYTFISSVSVYPDTAYSQTGLDETTPVATLDEEGVEEVTGETYGPLKALCEQAAEAAMPGRVLNVRPGLIVGPYDPSGRFAYWVRRVALGGQVLAPGRPERVVQLIDARDLAEWILRMAEARRPGVFNAAGPATHLTMGQLLETCRAASASQASFTWVSEEFLLQNEVGPFNEMPLWLPEAWNGMLAMSNARALATGLTFRPLATTVQDTLDWLLAQAGGSEGLQLGELTLRSGLDPAREAQLLRAWHRLEQP